MLLRDKVVVVSGIGPGLGRSIALQCASAGADLVLAARTESRLTEVAKEVTELGRRAVVVATDINDEAAVANLVETARDALEVLFRLEEGFGARPEADAGGARVAVDPAAPGAQKLDAAVRAWAAMRARRDSGEISEEEYLDWKRGFAER